MNNKKNSYILKSSDFNFILSYEGFSFNDEHRLKNFISNFNHNISLEFSKELIKDIKNNCNDRLPIVDIYDKKFWNAIYFKGRSEVIKLAHYFKPKGFNLWQKFMDDCANENQKLSTSHNSLLFGLVSHLNSKKTDFIPEPDKIIVIVNKLIDLKQKNLTSCILDFLKYCTNNSENFDSKEILDLFFSLQKQYSSFPKFSFKKNGSTE